MINGISGFNFDLEDFCKECSMFEVEVESNIIQTSDYRSLDEMSFGIHNISCKYILVCRRIKERMEQGETE